MKERDVTFQNGREAFERFIPGYEEPGDEQEDDFKSARAAHELSQPLLEAFRQRVGLRKQRRRPKGQGKRK